MSFQDLGERIDDRLAFVRVYLRRLAVKLGLRPAPPPLSPMFQAYLRERNDDLSKPNTLLEDMPWVDNYKGVPIRTSIPAAVWRTLNGKPASALERED